MEEEGEEEEQEEEEEEKGEQKAEVKRKEGEGGRSEPNDKKRWEEERLFFPVDLFV